MARHPLLYERGQHEQSSRIGITVLSPSLSPPRTRRDCRGQSYDVMYQDFTPLLPDLRPFVMGLWGENDVPRHWL